MERDRVTSFNLSAGFNLPSASDGGPVNWRKSARCAGNGACVEVGGLPSGAVAARDAHYGDASPVLTFSAYEWRVLVEKIKAGLLNLS